MKNIMEKPEVQFKQGDRVRINQSNTCGYGTVYDFRLNEYTVKTVVNDSEVFIKLSPQSVRPVAYHELVGAKAPQKIMLSKFYERGTRYLVNDGQQRYIVQISQVILRPNEMDDIIYVQSLSHMVTFKRKEFEQIATVVLDDLIDEEDFNLSTEQIKFLDDTQAEPDLESLDEKYYTLSNKEIDFLNTLPMEPKEAVSTTPSPTTLTITKNNISYSVNIKDGKIILDPISIKDIQQTIQMLQMIENILK